MKDVTVHYRWHPLYGQMATVTAVGSMIGMLRCMFFGRAVFVKGERPTF